MRNDRHFLNVVLGLNSLKSPLTSHPSLFLSVCSLTWVNVGQHAEYTLIIYNNMQIIFVCFVIATTTNNGVKDSYTFTQQLIYYTVSRTAYATIQSGAFTEASNPRVSPQGCNKYSQRKHKEEESTRKRSWPSFNVAIVPLWEQNAISSGNPASVTTDRRTATEIRMLERCLPYHLTEEN